MSLVRAALGERERLQRRPGAHVLDECSNLQVRLLPFGINRKNMRECADWEGSRKIAHHEVVLESLPAIFPTL